MLYELEGKYGGNNDSEMNAAGYVSEFMSGYPLNALQLEKARCARVLQQGTEES